MNGTGPTSPRAAPTQSWGMPPAVRPEPRAEAPITRPPEWAALAASAGRRPLVVRPRRPGSRRALQYGRPIGRSRAGASQPKPQPRVFAGGRRADARNEYSKEANSIGGGRSSQRLGLTSSRPLPPTENSNSPDCLIQSWPDAISDSARAPLRRAPDVRRLAHRRSACVQFIMMLAGWRPAFDIRAVARPPRIRPEAQDGLGGCRWRRPAQTPIMHSRSSLALGRHTVSNCRLSRMFDSGPDEYSQPWS
jgi:hypothetical protein